MPCLEPGLSLLGREIDSTALTLSAGPKFLCLHLPGRLQTREIVLIFKGGTVLVTSSVISREAEKPTTTPTHPRLSHPRKKASVPPGSILTPQGDGASVPDTVHILVTIPQTPILAGNHPTSPPFSLL